MATVGKARIPAEEAGKETSGCPLAYGPETGKEKTGSSKRRAAPKPSFTKSNRWAAHEAELRKNTVPGPGAYG